MTGLSLSDREVEDLYAALKLLEARLPPRLVSLLRRVEQSLYQRLTVDELETLARGSAPD
jgi:hypothetical protein